MRSAKIKPPRWLGGDLATLTLAMAAVCAEEG
jgi:hypothetical protein